MIMMNVSGDDVELWRLCLISRKERGNSLIASVSVARCIYSKCFRLENMPGNSPDHGSVYHKSRLSTCGKEVSVPVFKR